MKKYICITWILIVTLLLTLVAGCAKPEQSAAQPAEPSDDREVLPDDMPPDPAPGDEPASEPDAELQVTAADTYEQIQAELLAIRDRSELYWGDDMLATDSMEDAGSMDDAASDSAAAGDTYSQTNQQVAGVDEADVVKTDGEYIYMLREQEVVILRADGADTTDVGKIILPNSGPQENSYAYVSGMYLYDDVLAVVMQYQEWGYFDGSGNYVGKDVSQMQLLLYDVSDPADPKLTETFKQDGSGVASRMKDGVVYLISSYYVYDLESDDPQTYIPRVGSGTDLQLLPADDIILCPETDNPCYSVITTVDLAGAARLSQQAVLDGAGGCYMNQENLYLYHTAYVLEESEPRQEAQYTVVDYTETTKTTIMRFALEDGSAVLEATGQVEGGLLNQFSLDEYDGYLRLAMTNDSWSYQIYRDETYDFTNYRYPEESQSQSNSLYILDDSLKTVGKLEGFGLDERIYSVRFMGEMGYVVTFRETDPLFAIDLSDPHAPNMLSELKVTGFSSYLHPYDADLLVGIGMEANADTGATTGLKLSMFDISDPTHVTELDTEQVGDSWSEVLYDHKAALIQGEKDLIAFPGDGRYLVYGYNEADGLYLRGVFEDSAYDYAYQLRGLYIGSYLYVCTDAGVMVADLETMEQIAKIDLAYG